MQRERQREATRRHLIECAVEALLEGGYAALTTVSVQRRAGVSRGALLHHFPTRAALVETVVEEIVRRNETSVRETAERFTRHTDPVQRAVRTLHTALSTPEYAAELELWAVARTDAELRNVLVAAEREAKRDLNRVVANVFGPDLTLRPGYSAAVELTMALLRGLVIATPLRSGGRTQSGLMDQWARAIGALLDDK